MSKHDKIIFLAATGCVTAAIGWIFLLAALGFTFDGRF